MSFITTRKHWQGMEEWETDGAREQQSKGGEEWGRDAGRDSTDLQVFFCLPIKRIAQLWLSQRWMVRERRQYNKRGRKTKAKWKKDSFQGYDELGHRDLMTSRVYDSITMRRGLLHALISAVFSHCLGACACACVKAGDGNFANPFTVLSRRESLVKYATQPRRRFGKVEKWYCQAASLFKI